MIVISSLLPVSQSLRCNTTILLEVEALSTVNSELEYEWEEHLLEFGETYLQSISTESSYNVKIVGDRKFRVKITETSTGNTQYSNFIEITAVCSEYGNENCDAFRSNSGYTNGTLCKSCRGYCWGENYSGYSGYSGYIDGEGNFISGYSGYNRDDYEDLSAYSGVEFKTVSTPPSGYSPIETSSNYIINEEISTNITNTIKQLTNIAYSNSHLNPQVDDETDIQQIFTDYGLSIDSESDQETYRKLQQFEAENFSQFMLNEWLKHITNPIDKALGCLHSLINSGRVIIGKAMENIPNSSFVHIVANGDDIYTGRTNINVYLANLYEKGYSPILRYANGFVTKDYYKDDCVIVILRGVNKFYGIDDLIIGSKVFLDKNGGFSYSVIDSQDFPIEYNEKKAICQELGFVTSIDEITFTYNHPAYLNLYKIIVPV